MPLPHADAGQWFSPPAIPVRGEGTRQEQAGSQSNGTGVLCRVRRYLHTLVHTTHHTKQCRRGTGEIACG